MSQTPTFLEIITQPVIQPVSISFSTADDDLTPGAFLKTQIMTQRFTKAKVVRLTFNRVKLLNSYVELFKTYLSKNKNLEAIHIVDAGCFIALENIITLDCSAFELRHHVRRSDSPVLTAYYEHQGLNNNATIEGWTIMNNFLSVQRNFHRIYVDYGTQTSNLCITPENADKQEELTQLQGFPAINFYPDIMDAHYDKNRRVILGALAQTVKNPDLVHLIYEFLSC